ncbi:MAG: hypothetical protein M3P14_03320 [Chloroflexota bacterium]|nr:hypothetical protein [Chloroflexota bacterium]
MRKTVLYVLMSLDGDVDDPARYFVTSPEPDRPPEFDSVMHDNLARVIGAQDAVLVGVSRSGMYELVDMQTAEVIAP